MMKERTEYEPDWIRYEGHMRYHAIWVDQADGSMYMWCGRRVEAVQQQRRHITKQPRAKCQCCARRIAKPYMVPPWMKDLIRERGRGAA